MKVIELEKVSKKKIGSFLKNGVKLEPREEEITGLLALYGFVINAIKPVSTPKTKNPDFLIKRYGMGIESAYDF